MKRLFAISLLLTFAAGCTQPREAQFASGEGHNLLKVADYNDKAFTITTSEVLNDKRETDSLATEYHVDAKVVGGDASSIVNFSVDNTTVQQLLVNINLRGRPNYKYAGVMRLSKTQLKIYKIGAPEDIALTERTAAEVLADGRLAVPLVAYPVEALVTIEKSRNEMGDETATLTEKAQETVKTATHFRIDLEKPEVFAPAVKTDVLPIAYFGGSWTMSTEDANGPAAPQTVSFEPTQEALKILVDKDGGAKQTVLTLPVDWKSYSVADKAKAMSESEDTNLHWSKRPYVQLHYAGTQAANLTEGKTLVAVTLSDDSFSYVLQLNDSNTYVKYTFNRAAKK